MGEIRFSPLLISLLILTACSNKENHSFSYAFKQTQIFDGFGIVADFHVTSENEVFVFDSVELSIQKLDDKLNLETTLMLKNGEGPCELKNPRSMGVGAKNNIFITDLGNRRIYIFDMLGQCSSIATQKIVPAKILANSMGNFFVMRYPFLSSDSLLNCYNIDEVSGNDSQPFKKIMGRITDEKHHGLTGNSGRMILDSEENLYVTYSYPYVIRKYSPSLELVSHREVSNKYFSEPFYEKANFVKSNSRIIDICIINNQFLLVFYSVLSPQKILFDVFEKSTLQQIGTYDFKNKFGEIVPKHIRSDLKDHISISSDEPTPRIIIYEVI